mgnify:CR=1 FL=1
MIQISIRLTYKLNFIDNIYMIILNPSVTLTQ